MTVGDVRQMLSQYDDNEDICFAILDQEKPAVFRHFIVLKNGVIVQLSSFARDDMDGITDMAVDVLKTEGSLNFLLRDTKYTGWGE